jgi:hypothetical protein
MAARGKQQKERREKAKVEYDWGTLWPQYHKENELKGVPNERM